MGTLAGTHGNRSTFPKRRKRCKTQSMTYNGAPSHKHSMTSVNEVLSLCRRDHTPSYGRLGQRGGEGVGRRPHAESRPKKVPLQYVAYFIPKIFEKVHQLLTRSCCRCRGSSSVALKRRELYFTVLLADEKFEDFFFIAWTDIVFAQALSLLNSSAYYLLSLMTRCVLAAGSLASSVKCCSPT